MKHILKTMSFIFSITLFIFVCSCTESVPSTNKYTVTFKDFDGSVLKEEQVEEGNNATAPSDPIRDGYIFVGWDGEYTNIKNDTTLIAQYKTIPVVEELDNKTQIAFGGVTLNLTLEDSLQPVYNTTNKTIKASGSYNMFAPGIKNTIATLNVNGSPEVSMELLTIVNINLENWNVQGDYYCPLKISIGDVTLNGTNYSTENDFKVAIEDAIEQSIKENGKYNHGIINLDKIIYIELEWPFESSNDLLDTALVVGQNLTFELEIAITFNQLD